jgi:hypothetical protein
MRISKIAGLIHVVRGRRVMLDSDLAELYGVTTGNLNKSVRRNVKRFPGDFMFQLSSDEWRSLVFQIGISKKGRGGSRFKPCVFTEQGVAMLSSVLHTERAVLVNVEIMRAYVRLRDAMAMNRDLPTRIKNAESAIEAHDRELTEHAVHINEAFAAIRKLKKD